ncbi:hypothetical protein [Maridesulfovibrio ferrireducens]|nr:hypothetical protein [Maridesulfovibrio ferrireducens]
MSDRSYLQYLLALILFAFYSYLSMFGTAYFGDFGFTVTNYKYFISNPDSVYFWFANWVTLAAGWSVEALFSQYGMKIFIIACAAIYSVNFLLADAIVKLCFGKKYTVVVFLTSLFVLTGSSGYINRYSLTALFLNILLFFLAKYLFQGKREYLILAGFVGGVLCFVRIPNLAVISLCVVFFLGNDFKKGITDALFFIVSWVVGCCVVLLAIKLVGHYEYFILGLKVLIAKGKGVTENHNLFTMIERLLKDTLSAVALGGPFAIATFAVYSTLKGSTRLGLKKILTVAGFIVLATLIAYLAHRWLDLRFWHRYLFTGYILISGVVLLSITKNISFRIFIAALLIVSFVPMVGSANGLTRNIGGLWVLIPVVICKFLIPILSEENNFQVRYRKLVAGSILTLGILLWGIRIYPHLLYVAQCDVYDSKYTKQYDTEENVGKCQDELDKIGKFTSVGDSMITYEQSSMLYYLLDTVPYLHSPEPIFWGPQLQGVIDQVVGENLNLPIVVESVIDLKILGHEKNKETMHTFLSKNKYKLVWSNENFTVYLPK